MTGERAGRARAGIGDIGLDAIVDALLRATGASRTTIRGSFGPDPASVALLAEALAPGVRSMADGPRAGIAEAPTYAFLRQARRILVQPDCAEDPLPPASLTDGYGVRAQMLAPVLDGETLIGTVSVHQQGRTRQWSAADVAALEAAADAVQQWRDAAAR